MSTITYNITMFDFDGPAPAWMRGPTAVIREKGVGRQEDRMIDGKIQTLWIFDVVVNSDRVAELESALEGDAAVLTYRGE